METKQINKAVSKMVDKFATVYTAYENGLDTEDKLKKSACAQIAVLIRLKETEALSVDNLIEGFTKVITADREELEEVVDKVCTDLYQLVRETKE